MAEVLGPESPEIFDLKQLTSREACGIHSFVLRDAQAQHQCCGTMGCGLTPTLTAAALAIVHHYTSVLDKLQHLSVCINQCLQSVLVIGCICTIPHSCLPA